MDTNKVRPFDSFSAVYKILIWAGYFRPLNGQDRYLVLHKLYRLIAFVIVVVYNLQHLIVIAQPSNPTDLRIEGLMTEIPQINLLSKVLTVTLYSSRIDKINELLNDPIFAANGEEEEQYLMMNIKEMRGLSRMMVIFVTFCGVCWPVSNILQRLRDAQHVVPFYVPFKTDTWTRYVMLCLMQVLPLLWVGYGHVLLDCLVATYYAQVQVQLKIIKHNLIHLFDAKSVKSHDGHCSINQDKSDVTLYSNFVYNVKRYEKLVWYTNEVNSVFNPSIAFQFFTSSATLCMVIYKMSETYVLSVQFMFLMGLIGILLIQVFLYCYYGNLVRHESESVNTWLYLSEWTSAPRRLRRALLIAMSRWSKPLTTKVAGIIPLALDTFIAIIRMSYTLYTVLSTKHVINESSKTGP